MDHYQEWPMALRLVWLAGGLVALNEPEDPNVHVRSHVSGGTFFSFPIAAYPSLFAELRSLGLLVIGTTFITDETKLQGLRAPIGRKRFSARSFVSLCTGKQDGDRTIADLVHIKDLTAELILRRKASRESARPGIKYRLVVC